MNCTECNSNTLIRFSGLSGWDFFMTCLDCANIDHYSVSDMQAQEGNGPIHHLLHSGDKAKEEFAINQKAKELKLAEEGWQNTNGKIYEQYDRLMYTAKNLLKNEKI